MPKFQSIDLAFPLAGIDVSQAFVTQKASVTPLGASYDQSFQQQRFETTRSATNVRGFDALQGRFRGGTRPGLTRYTTQGLTGPIQCLIPVVTVGITPPGGTQQASAAGRVVTLVAVDGSGNVKVLSPGQTSWVTPTGGTAALAANASSVTGGFVQATVCAVLGTTNPVTTAGATVWFADGLNYKKYVLATNTVSTWALAFASPLHSSAGTLPANSGNFPRLICTWRGRVVQSGIKTDPQNWFMSMVGYPTDWNTSATPITSTMAVTGNNSPMGLVGDVVSALVPINDDNLLFLCDHSTWIMRGDPMSGGQLTQLIPGIGATWGSPWCMDTEGVVYWLSNQAGVYQFSQFDYPRRISSRIDPILRNINTGTNLGRMVWDDYMQGFHLFLTNTNTLSGTHFFWEKRTGAWWQDSFGSPNLQPTACCLFDGNLITDRRALIGCSDGAVRYFDPAATIDENYPILSSVVLGPVVSGTSELMLRDLKVILGAGSGAVTWQLLTGPTAEQGLGTVVASGTLAAGNNPMCDTRVAGKAIYLKLSSSSQWAVERIKASVADLGRIRARA